MATLDRHASSRQLRSLITSALLRNRRTLAGSASPKSADSRCGIWGGNSQLCQGAPPHAEVSIQLSLRPHTPHRLLIKGIRSFSPDNTVVLQFDTPLTLIVGQNGAGKTVRRDCMHLEVTLKGSQA